jgi:Tfp pilus assembly protein PilX
MTIYKRRVTRAAGRPAEHGVPCNPAGSRLEDTRRQRGAALVLAVLLLLPLGVLGAYFMDTARLYVIRGRMQAAADAAALAAASALIDGDENGDSVQARAAHYVTANAIGGAPATLESLAVDLDSGKLQLVLSYATGSMLLLPGGVTLRVRSAAQAQRAHSGEIGRPIPNGNAFGWWKDGDDGLTEGSDSAVVRLSS